MNELMTQQTANFLERAVRDPTIDVNKLEHLIALQERVADREAKRQYAEAMAALQSEMPQIGKDKTNPHARSRYASYESVDAVLRPLYTHHGFSVSFTTQANGSRIRVGCTVRHIGGHETCDHELESGPDMTGAKGTSNKTEVQGIGSIVSYLKRYTMMAAFAVALKDDDDDDDGEASRTTARDRQAERAYGTREDINRDVPMDGQAKPQRTPEQLLDGLEIAMRDCGSLAEVNKLIANRHVQDMLRDYKNGHKARLDGIIAAGIGAHAPVTHDTDAWPSADADVDSAAEPAHA